MIDTEELLLLISEYMEKHELAKELGGEYIYQDNKAQQDAIKLVADIFENCFSENIDEKYDDIPLRISHEELFQ
jgi:hypothetical protein